MEKPEEQAKGEKQAKGVVLIDHLEQIKDPRRDQTKLHKMTDILVIAIFAVISGATGWEDIEGYGEAKYEWLKQYLELPNGIPSHDTFQRLFARLKPSEFQQCFLKWIAAVSEVSKGEIVAIDGKTLRRSFDRANGKAAIHVVSAWAKTNRLVLGQVKVDDKSNEITAIPKLLNLLDIAGCIVTIDAMGCQKDIAAQIIDKGADYVLSLKGNHGNLHQQVESFFINAQLSDFVNVKHSFHETTNQGHGRQETRRCWTVSAVNCLSLDQMQPWAGLHTITMLKSYREIADKVSFETSYFISSLSPNANKVSAAIRGHWSIENELHWVLDVAFREDDSRIRADHAAENFAILRHIAINLLKQHSAIKVGIKAKTRRAGWDNDYLLSLLCT